MAVAQGWAGESGLPCGAISGPQNYANISRVLVFKLGADAALPGIDTAEQALPADVSDCARQDATRRRARGSS